MKRLLLLILLVSSTLLNAQQPNIQFDSKKLNFDNGRELPAETGFIINTVISPETQMLKVFISKNRFEGKHILSESTWIRKWNSSAELAVIPVFTKLRSSSEYNLKFIYYRELQDNERQQLKSMLRNSVLSYIETNIKRQKRRFVFESNPEIIYETLNNFITEGLQNFTYQDYLAEPKFSELVQDILFKMTLKQNNSYSATSNGDLLDVLKEQLLTEIESVTNQYQYAVFDVIEVLKYPTEKKLNTLSLDLGYSGIYENGNFNQLNYYSGPSLGISLPLGNKEFSNTILANTSISTGIFLRSFTNDKGNTLSGPLIDFPIYAGLNYKFFRFLRLQGGIVLLEESGQNIESSIYFKPYLGLSMQFQLWVGLSK